MSDMGFQERRQAGGTFPNLLDVIRSIIPASPYASSQETPPEPTPKGGLPAAAPGQGDPGVRPASEIASMMPTPSDETPPPEATPGGGLPQLPPTVQPGEGPALRDPQDILGIIRQLLTHLPTPNTQEPPREGPLGTPGGGLPPNAPTVQSTADNSPMLRERDPQVVENERQAAAAKAAAPSVGPPAAGAATLPTQKQEELQPKPIPPGAKPADIMAQWPLPQRQDVQAFVPNSPRGYEKWGQNHPPIDALPNNPGIVRGPHMPTPAQAYPTIYGSGQQLATYAAPGVGGPAGIASRIAGLFTPLMDLVGGGQFSLQFGKAQAHALANAKARLAMNREHYEQQRDRMLDAGEDSVREHKRMLMDYGGVFKQYKIGAIDEAQANQMIGDLNRRYGHRTLDGILQNSGLGGVERYLDWEDAKMRDMWSSTESLRQSDRTRKTKSGISEDTDLDKEWSGSGGSGAGAGAGERPLPFRGPAAEPGAPPSTPGGGGPEPGSVDAEIAKKHDLSQSGMDAAHALMRDGKIPGVTAGQGSKMSPKKYDDVVTAAGDLGSRINKIASSNDPAMTPEKKLEEIRKVDPSVAETIDGLRGYRTNPASLGDQRRHYTQLAAAVDKNYKESFYETAKKFRDAGSPQGKILLRSDVMAKGSLAVLEALKELPEGTKIPMRQIEAQIATRWTGDPKFDRLYAALRTFAAEANAVTNQGAVRVTMVDNLLKHMGPTTDPRSIRAQIKVEMYSAYGAVETLNDNWKAETGSNTNAPMLRDENLQIMKNVLRMNEHTQRYPADAPDRLLNTEKPKQEKYPHLKKGQDYEPVPDKEREVLQGYIKENRNSSDPRVLEQIRRAREKLGIAP